MVMVKVMMAVDVILMVMEVVVRLALVTVVLVIMGWDQECSGHQELHFQSLC